MWRLRAPLLALLLMQVILLASSGVTATKKPLGKQETCNMKNHMIEYLRNNGVQIYERPQIDSVICQTEWTSFGTCCEQTSIQSAITKKIHLNNQAVTILAEELQLIFPAIKAYYEKHVIRPLNAKGFSNLPRGNGVSFMVTRFDMRNEEMYDKILKPLQSMLSNETIKHQTKCVSTLNEIISKSACSICSGRSDDFFSSDGRLAISEPTCRAVLRSCNTAWTNMVMIAEAVRGTAQFIRTFSQNSNFGFEFGVPEELGFTMNLDSFITNRNLIPIMQKCGSQMADCSFEHVAALCEQFIHIQAPTYIESSQSQIMRIMSHIDSATKSYHGEKSKIESAREVLGRIATFSVQNTTSLALGVTALETIHKQIILISLDLAKLQIEDAKLKKLWFDKTPRTQEILQQTNRLIEEIQQAMKEHFLFKHEYLLKITVATKSAEAVVKYENGKEIRHSVETKALRKKIEMLWDNFHYYYELLKEPRLDMTQRFGMFINGYSHFWLNFQKEDAMTIELLKKIYSRVYGDIARSVSLRGKDPGPAKWSTSMMVNVPDRRTLSMLLRSPEHVRNGFTMETIVVRDDSASVDLQTQSAGVVPFLTTP